MKSRTTLIFIASILATSCGSSPNDRFQTDPQDSFASAKETLKTDKFCEKSGVSGCSNFVASGNSVGNSFNFKNMYTTCEASDNGYVIQIQNTRDATPTFQANLNFYKVASPSGEYICLGPEFSSTSPVYVLKEGYCGASFVIHSTAFTATVNEECTVTFTSTRPIKGKIDCPQLSAGDFYLTIDGSSAFECQP